MKARRPFTVLGTVLAAACLTAPTLAQLKTPPLPGEVRGIGHHFEIVDSDYLNVTLDSSEQVDVHLHAMGETILISIEGVSGAASTRLTLGGLAPSTTYFLFEDGADTERVFTSDGEGRYSFDQALTEPHLLSIRTQAGTYWIHPERNDCNLFGSWDAATQTCTLTHDVSDWLFIAHMTGVTLDGNGHRLTVPETYPLFLYQCHDCTVKNLDQDGYYGVIVNRSQDVTVTNNAIRARSYGIYAWYSPRLTATHNTLEGWDPSYTAFRFWLTDDAVVHDNTIRGFRDGSYFYRSRDNVIYNNNFAEMPYPVSYYGSSYGNVFHKPLPEGGNCWSRYDDPYEGCYDVDGDGICDDRYDLGSGQFDDEPWVEPDGWPQPPVADAGPDRTLSATCENADRTTSVMLDGSGSYDPDGDTLSYRWSGPTCPTVTGMTPEAHLGLGTHAITLTLDDGTGRSDSDDVTLTLEDWTAPALTSPAALQVTCTQVSAAGRGRCPSSDAAVADWIASVQAIDACDPAPAMTDDCPPMLEVNATPVTFTGTDASGNTGNVTSSIQVVYGWGGFNEIKGGKAGRTIPVRFRIDCGDTSVSAAVASIAVYDVLGGPEMTGGGHAFRYDADERQYIFNLSTKGYDAPATYRIEAHLDDGTVKTAEFSLR